MRCTQSQKPEALIVLPCVASWNVCNDSKPSSLMGSVESDVTIAMM